MIFPLTETWIGPIKCDGPFFVQPKFGEVCIWWGVETTGVNFLTVHSESGVDQYDLNDPADKMGEVIHAGETRTFGMIPGQYIYLRANTSKAAVVVEQWWS